jgi:hypothetical protein
MSRKLSGESIGGTKLHLSNVVGWFDFRAYLHYLGAICIGEKFI